VQPAVARLHFCCSLAINQLGTTGPAQTFSPAELWDIELTAPHRPVELALPEGHNAIVFVRRGGVRVGAKGQAGCGERDSRERESRAAEEEEVACFTAAAVSRRRRWGLRRSQ